MTLGNLVQTCENIGGNTEIMIFHTIEDFESCSDNWNSCKAESARSSEMKIVRFKIVNNNLVTVALL